MIKISFFSLFVGNDGYAFNNALVTKGMRLVSEKKLAVEVTEL